MGAYMSVLNIDRWLLKPPKNRIKYCGIELEGGWAKWPEGESPNFHHDGSVKIPVGSLPVKVGEIVSSPMEPAAVGKWVRKWYPHVANDTCGLHIHMSFFFLRHYRRLMVVDYQDTIIEYLRRWAEKEETFPHDKECGRCVGLSHPNPSCGTCKGTGKVKGHHIWPRLDGKEKYCHLKFWPDEQVKMTKHGDQSSPDRFFKHGSRYTAINYCFGIDNRQTLEVRVLPMMATADQSVGALREVIKITNACLAALRGDTRGDRAFYSAPAMDLTVPIEEDEVLVL